VIKEDAELCPNCGVRPDTAGNTSGANHTPETTTSSKWWYGIAVSGVLWLLIGVFSYSAVSSVTGTAPLENIGAVMGASFLEGLLRLGVWILFPLSMYFDTDFVVETSDWQPSGAVFATIGGILPVVHVVFVLLGLFSSSVFAVLTPLLGVGISTYYLKVRSERVGSP
jgi:hypothetical protein